ncbi:MAG: NAD(P)-dependent alcohol dehydrogenase [Melioribacteraceae bacterium]|nr:NAD(P)-dependent alcohol dehydrogenase [Melioribacteraceae bacterium]
MKAIILSKYGPPLNLETKEIEIPIPQENEVLIKIKATAVNDYDWSMVRGKPYIYRLMYGLIKPKRQIPGMELAGIVEAVGRSVKSLAIGDSVYGDISNHGFGTFAEYICVDEKAVVNKPEQMSFEEAASLPHASLLALQGLRDLGNIENGQKILINGGGGGVGTIGLQIAKLYDCEITGVDSRDKFETMTSIGFDHLIDYQIEDFTKNGKQYDLILDCKTTRSPFSYLRSLKTNGVYITIGGYLTRILQILLFKGLISLFSKKQLKILALKPNRGIDTINELYLKGKIKCIIDGPYPLGEAPRLIDYFGEGKHKGKVVLKIDGP